MREVLGVRVYIVLKTPVGTERLVWDELAPPRDERKLEGMLRAFSAESRLLGEIMGLRLRDGKGRGCTVTGSMLGCELTQEEEETIAAVRFSDENWRVW